MCACVCVVIECVYANVGYCMLANSLRASSECVCVCVG